MEEELSNWEQEEVLDDDLILDYDEYTDFNEKQDYIYQNLFEGKILKNDSIKFY